MIVLQRFFSSLKTFFNTILFRICVFILKYRGVPKHVGLIVDGNRTYSKRRGVALPEAYMRGVNAILLQIKLSSVFEIENLSFFLFSIFNWERKNAEKEPILKAIAALIKIVLLNPYGCRFETIGDVSELPQDFRSLCDELVQKTKHNRGALIYFSINYSAKVEMIDAAKTILNEPSYQRNISVDLVDDLMYTSTGNKPDLLIRTSGHKRYSDFFLWQNAFNPLYFSDIFWPEFTEWSMLQAIFYYQLNYRKCMKIREQAERLHKKCS